MKTRNSWFLTGVLCAALGCQSSGSGHPAVETVTSAPAVAPEPQVAEETSDGFSIGRALRWVAFWQPEEDEAGPVPQEIANLSGVVDSIVARASELSVHDPPEVTRQKAQAILHATRPWDSLLAAGRSVGLINDQMAHQLNQWVLPIKAKATQLAQHGTHPETIGAVQQLAHGLNSSFQSLSSALDQGAAAYQNMIRSAKVWKRS